MTEKEIELKVSEAYTRDVGRGIARIDTDAMMKLGISTGDVVQISGKRKTVAKALPLYPSDEGRGMIRADGLIRQNASVSIDDKVQIGKIAYENAQSLTLSPSEPIPPVNSQAIAEALEGLPVSDGDHVFVPYFGGRMAFKVVKVRPNAQASVITIKTSVTISETVGGDGVPSVTYEDIGGLKDEIQKVREMIELPLRHPEIFEKLGVEAPKGVLLYGPPGTGKTLLAKAVANESNAHFISISGPEIMSKFYGQSEENVRHFFQEAKEKAPSIIFIDEIDSIAPKREEVMGEVEHRVVSQLLSAMDGLEARGKVVVIGATNRPNALDPALRRPGRFDREIEIKVPDAKGRLDILQIHTRHMPMADDVDLQKMAGVTHGFVGADLEYLAKEAAMKTLRRILPDLKLEDEAVPPALLKKLVVVQQDFEDALKSVTPSAMREVYLESPNVKWTEIGGLEEVKKELREAVEWPLKFPDLYKAIGYSMPKGILLHGPSGTGKTLLAKAVATESEANFINVKGPELISKFVGESERGVREVFRRARQASPCIIFFDELDSLAPVRGMGMGDSMVTERVVSQLLTELDGVQDLQGVVVLAATNRVDMIDPALLRAGRFDKLVQIPMPDEPTRKKIVELKLKGKNLASDVDSEKLTKMTENLTGADIAGLVNGAASVALQRFITKYQTTEAVKKNIAEAKIEMKDFEDAVQKVRASRSSKERQASVPYYR